MKKIWQVYSYFKYRIQAKSRFNIHSPFVFKIINEVLRDKQRYDDYAKLNKIHKRYRKRKDKVETRDFGSRSGTSEYKVKIDSVGNIVKQRSHSRKQLELLYRLSKYFNPATILEFGTAAGISTNYLAKGSPDSRIITMEGCMGLSSIAIKNFKKRNLDIEVEVGEFDAIIDHVLKGVEKLDMVYFDGNHRKKPTLNYFNKCIDLSGENSVFMFDDIHWSVGMNQAWNKIKKDNRVSLTIDLYWIGLVFFNKGITKQNFVVKY